jgi:hypothetical protein
MEDIPRRHIPKRILLDLAVWFLLRQAILSDASAAPNGRTMHVELKSLGEGGLVPSATQATITAFSGFVQKTTEVISLGI